MDLIVLSLNVKRASLELREKLSFVEAELSEALLALKAEDAVLESVILSTCNRTELYAVVDHPKRGADYLKRFLSHWFSVPLSVFSDYLELAEGLEVASYLFRVACGLESLIVGEEQILAQVKDALTSAQAVQSTGSVLNTLFKQAITLSKRAHTETALSRNSVSVGTAAVQLAKRELGVLADKRALIIGAGKIGSLSAKYLSAQGVSQLYVANRTFSKATELASQFGGEAIGLDDLAAALQQVDFVFSSTAARDYVLTWELVESVQRRRSGRSLLLFDLAVPRDVEPSVAELDGVSLFDIDDFKNLVVENKNSRKQAEIEVEGLIGAAVVEFEQWFSVQAAFPLISALQERSMGVQEQVMATVDRKLPDLVEHDRKLVNKLTKSIVHQLLREPILQVKALANEPDAAENLKLFEKIFGLELK